MKGNSKREQLIQVGIQVIVQKGFNAASLNDILQSAGIPKGSFYYYFASKEDFGLAIIDHFAANYEQRMKILTLNEADSPLARLHHYFELGIADMKNCQCNDGCLIGNLAQELSAKNEIFRDRLNQIFQHWQDCFQQCLQSAIIAGEIKHSNLDASELAQFILTGWEGAILQAKVMKSVSPMENFRHILFKQVL